MQLVSWSTLRSTRFSGSGRGPAVFSNTSGQSSGCRETNVTWKGRGSGRFTLEPSGDVAGMGIPSAAETNPWFSEIWFIG